ncbi:MAG TPA: FAD binding domain-containing protein [Candidatus Sulfotelmatobacter sp.]|nr:FAD binding domain-containing protein [Candidatus Sulfotelmatobacter sp.]
MSVQEYLMPRSLPEALDLLVRHGAELLVIAGGTVAMPLVNEGISLPERVMSLRHAGLDRLERRDGRLEIGAAATLTRLLNAPWVADVPLLAEAVRNTASWPVRNMGTVGGNLFTPPPGGDVAVALLALDAEVRLASPRGERVLPLTAFYTGFMTNALGPDELLAGITVPLAARETAFLKLGRKHANTPAVVTVAVALEREAGRVATARVALGAAGPHPMRVAGAEAALVGSPLDAATIGRAAEAATAEAQPFTDGVATEWYRRRMVGVVLRRALERLT